MALNGLQLLAGHLLQSDTLTQPLRKTQTDTSGLAEGGKLTEQMREQNTSAETNGTMLN